MNDFDKLVNALYEFVLFELSKKEQDYKYLVSAYYHATITAPNGKSNTKKAPTL